MDNRRTSIACYSHMHWRYETAAQLHCVWKNEDWKKYYRTILWTFELLGWKKNGVQRKLINARGLHKCAYGNEKKQLVEFSNMKEKNSKCALYEKLCSTVPGAIYNQINFYHNEKGNSYKWQASARTGSSSYNEPLQTTVHRNSIHSTTNRRLIKCPNYQTLSIILYINIFTSLQNIAVWKWSNNQKHWLLLHIKYIAVGDAS